MRSFWKTSAMITVALSTGLVVAKPTLQVEQLFNHTAIGAGLNRTCVEPVISNGTTYAARPGPLSNSTRPAFASAPFGNQTYGLSGNASSGSGTYRDREAYRFSNETRSPFSNNTYGRPNNASSPQIPAIERRPFGNSTYVRKNMTDPCADDLNAASSDSKAPSDRWTVTTRSVERLAEECKQNPHHQICKALRRRRAQYSQPENHDSSAGPEGNANGGLHSFLGYLRSKQVQ